MAFKFLLGMYYLIDLFAIKVRKPKHGHLLKHFPSSSKLNYKLFNMINIFLNQCLDDGHPSLNVIVKGDVDGTVEAILDTLATYNSSQCDLDIVQEGVGAITPNDIEMAEAFDAVIYAFNVPCSEPMRELAEATGVHIKEFNVIYKLIDDVKEEINKRLPAKEVEDVVGKANVLQQFMVNEGRKKVPIAGCRCIEGVLKRNAKYKLIRDGVVIYEGKWCC